MKIVDLLKKLFSEETECDSIFGGYVDIDDKEVGIEGYYSLEKMQKKLDEIEASEKYPDTQEEAFYLKKVKEVLENGK